SLLLCCCFFFQAEDGIRDFHVTGVQTCALPIYVVTYGLLNLGFLGVILIAFAFGILCKYIDSYQRKGAPALSIIVIIALIFIVEIGRASCRKECSSQ